MPAFRAVVIPKRDAAECVLNLPLASIGQPASCPGVATWLDIELIILPAVTAT